MFQGGGQGTVFAHQSYGNELHLPRILLKVFASADINFNLSHFTLKNMVISELIVCCYLLIVKAIVIQNSILSCLLSIPKKLVSVDKKPR